jgi:hypothetical protein
MGNMYYAYTHLTDYKNWSELFGLIEEEPIFQKRVLSIVSGAILPIVALGFIKSLVDYIRPSTAEDIKEEYEAKKAIEDEIAREAIEEFVPTNEEDLAEIEKIKTEIANIESNDEISDKEKSRKTEQKIAKAIAKNPELKKQIEEKIREIDEEDTYTKSETNAEENNSPPARFGGM